MCLLLPYRYETGGDAEIFPLSRVTLAPEVDGLVEWVFVNGGEWVTAGTVLARMADYRQLNELRILESDIAAKRFDIERYRTTPLPEEVALAEEKVASARIQRRYSEDKLKRQEELLAQNFISSQAFEDSRNLADRDRQTLSEALSSLAALKAQVNPYQIETLKAELQKLEREADYYREQLKRTNLFSPIDGQVITPDLQYLRNSYLEAGTTFAQIEDTRTVLLHVAVPESDVGDLSLGARIRLKLWAYQGREFSGTVDEIQPSTEKADFGRIVYGSPADRSAQDPSRSLRNLGQLLFGIVFKTRG